VPHLFHVSEAKNTFVIEDLGPDSADLAEYLSRFKISPPGNTGKNVARDLGRWLRAFHQWTLQDGREGLRNAMRGYEESGKFKRSIVYGGILPFCEKVGILDESTRESFEKVQELVAEEFVESRTRPVSEEWGPTHGDFWTGKYVDLRIPLSRRKHGLTTAAPAFCSRHAATVPANPISPSSTGNLPISALVRTISAR
jgi:hypothetical protein